MVVSRLITRLYSASSLVTNNGLGLLERTESPNFVGIVGFRF